MIFDTHAHYDDEQFDNDREALLASFASAGISGCVNVGSTRESLARCMELAHRYPFVWAAAGLHPDEIGDLTGEVIDEIRADLLDEKCVAVGEIGLDYYWDKESHEQQIAAFRRQIEIALDAEKPVLIHSRSAAEDTMRVVKEYYGKGGSRVPGVLHCYSYSPEMAREYVAMGFFLGIGGVVTFKNARKLKETVAETPLDHLVLETDCPYLAPEPFRGKRNSSLYLPYVVRAVAELKGVSEAEAERVTEENARRLFGI